MLFGKANTEVTDLLLPVVWENVWDSRIHRRFAVSVFQAMGLVTEQRIWPRTVGGQLTAYSHPRRAWYKPMGLS